MALTDDSLEHLGRDLLVTPFFAGNTWSTFDLELRRRLDDREREIGDGVDDVGVATGVEALRQALVLRLLTPRGSLAALGHAGYGSRVHELIGQENNRRNRLLLRARVLETLLQEPRVATVEALEVNPDALDGGIIHVHAQVRPIDSQQAEQLVSLNLEVSL